MKRSACIGSSMAAVALATVASGCGGGSSSSSAAPGSESVSPSASAPASTPSATGAGLDVTSRSGFKYRLSAGSVVAAPQVDFGETIGTLDAPDGTEFITVSVQVTNTSADRTEPLSEGEGSWVFAVPAADKDQFAGVNNDDPFFCPSDDVGVPKQSCDTSVRLARVDPEPDLPFNEAQMAPGQTMTLFLSLDTVAVSSAPLSHVTLFWTPLADGQHPYIQVPVAG
jgi:hypothetical protein